jgi:quercetin dioxygenase-like cupin family protein
MNTKDLHPEPKAVSIASLFKTTEGNVTSLQILAGEQLKEHITKVPALLICLTGEAIFENEEGLKLTLTTGEYVNIEPQIKHWINAKSISNLILIK